MSNAQKFTFDTIFDKSGRVLKEAPAPEKRTYRPEEVEEIRQQAVLEGKRSADAMADQALASSLKQMAAVVESLFHILDQEVETVRTEAAQLALVISSKIAGTLLEAYPTAAIEALINECLANLRSEPHIHIQVHPDHAEGIKTRLDETIQGRTFQGQIHIDPSNGLGQTDVRIEWANGGVEKSPQDLIQSITEIIEKKWNLQALTGEEATLEEQPSSHHIADTA